jgi:hypothetical protein
MKQSRCRAPTPETGEISVVSTKTTAPRVAATVPPQKVKTTLPTAPTRNEKDRQKTRVLFLCDYNVKSAPANCDFINSFLKYSKNEVVIVSCLGGLQRDVKMRDFDVVVVHFSLTLALDSYITPAMRKEMSEFTGLKMLFIQDEYRFIDHTIDAIEETGMHVIFTVTKPSQRTKVYPEGRVPGVHFEHILTGYVPKWLTVYGTTPYKRRKFDVTYRGRSYPAWHGQPGRDRIIIGQRFLKESRRFGLKCDIRWDEKSRLYGAFWVEFLRQSRAQLCTESAIGVYDRDGVISSKTETYVNMLYKPEDQAKINEREYTEIKEKFFKDREGEVDSSVISPRAFEAVAIRTLLIMYEGEYSGIFKPWRHYIPLKKDHSNMAEVVEALKDEKRSAEIIANAYAEIAQNPAYQYRTLVARFDEIIAEKLQPEMLSDSHYFDKAFYARVAPFNFFDNPYAIGADELNWLIALKSKARSAKKSLLKMFSDAPRDTVTGR